MSPPVPQCLQIWRAGCLLLQYTLWFPNFWVFFSELLITAQNNLWGFPDQGKIFCPVAGMLHMPVWCQIPLPAFCFCNFFSLLVFPFPSFALSLSNSYILSFLVLFPVPLTAVSFYCFCFSKQDPQFLRPWEGDSSTWLFTIYSWLPAVESL